MFNLLPEAPRKIGLRGQQCCCRFGHDLYLDWRVSLVVNLGSKLKYCEPTLVFSCPRLNRGSQGHKQSPLTTKLPY